MAKAKRTYKLHVVERGKGRPVVLLHGGFSTHRYWDDVVALLDAKRKLFLPDLLGFGKSPKPRDGQYSLKQFTDCLDYTFEDYNFKEKPILAGHSAGANVALEWAARHPEKFESLVLSSPLLFTKQDFHQQLATIPLEGKWLKNKRLARLVVGSMALSGFVPADLAMRFANNRPRRVIEDVTSQSFIVFRKMIKNVQFYDAVMDDLKKINIPTRIIIGKQDSIANHALKTLEDICRKDKKCQLLVLPGSHQTLLEYPDDVARMILSL